MKGIPLILRHFILLSHSFEIRLLILAMTLGIAASSTLGFWQSRFLHEFDEKKASILAGDMVLTSFSPIPGEWIEIAKNAYHLRAEQSLETYTMVRAANGQTQLGMLFAIGQYFPLKGLITLSEVGKEKTVQHAPDRSTVWVSQRLLQGLKIKEGDTVSLGATAFKVAAVLEDMPNFSSDFFAIAPPLLINIQDIAASQLIKAGSRVSERWHFLGTEKDLADFQAWVTPQLANTVTLSNKASAGPALQDSFEKGVRYLNFANLMNLFLASLAILIAARGFIQKNQDWIALMRTMGLSSNQLLKILISYACIIACIAFTLGVTIGFFLQAGILELFKGDFLASQYTPTFAPVYQGMLLAFLMSLGFIMMPLWHIRKMPPLLVFKEKLYTTKAILGAIFTMALVLLAIIWLEIHDLAFALPLLGYILIGLSFIYFLVLKVIALLGRYNSKDIALYFSIQNFKNNASMHALETVLFSSILFVLLLIGNVRESLLQTWQSQVKSDAPNYFLVNIENSELPNVQTYFKSHGINTLPFYPMMRASLVKINDEAILQVTNGIKSDRKSMNRPLNLSWATQLPEDNEVVTGQPWESAGADTASVEQGFADRMGIHVGDKLTFSLGDRIFWVKVSNIRKVKWENFHPNFFVLTKPAGMQSYSYTLISSFYLPECKSSLIGDFNKKFPTISVIDVQTILKQIEQVIRALAFILTLIFYFTFAAALLVMLVLLQSNLQSKIQHAALLRVMGATKTFIQKMIVNEWVIQTFLSGSIAVLAAMAASQWLAIKYFHLNGISPSLLWFVTPVVAACVIVPLALWGSRSIWKTHPKVLLKQI